MMQPSFTPDQVEFISSWLRRDSVYLALSTVFLAAGAAAIVLFLFRRSGRALALLYFGLIAVPYGVRLAAGTDVVSVITGTKAPWPWVVAVITYTINVPAVLLLMESLGRGWKSSIFASFVACVVLAAVSVPAAILTRNPEIAAVPNNLLVIASIAVATVNLFLRSAAPPQERRALLAGLPALFAAAVYDNVRALGAGLPRLNLEPAAFLLFITALGYVAARRSYANEERLIAIEHELETARRIQASILPETAPKLAVMSVAVRYAPMTQVAGDFYDFVTVDENRLGVLIADVSGHGVPAALVASMVKVALSSQGARAADPAALLTGINVILSRDLRSQFVTAGYLFVDAEARSFRYSGAGHPLPLLWRAAPRAVERFGDNGLIIGPFRNAEYTNTEGRLAPGDRIVLYTDGIPETSNRVGVPFGDEAFAQFIEKHSRLPVEAFAGRLLESLSEWAGPGRLAADDMTLVVIDFLPAQSPIHQPVTRL